MVLRWTFPQRAIYRRHLYRSGENLNRRRDGRQSQDEFDARERGPTPLPTLTNPPAATPGRRRVCTRSSRAVQLAILYFNFN